MIPLLKSRLFRQQFVASALLTALFLGTMTAGILWRTKSAIDEREAQIAGTYRDAMAKEFFRWLDERKSDMVYVAGVWEADASQNRIVSDLSARLDLFLRSRKAFSDLFVIGPDGYVISNKAGPAEHRVYLGDRDYFIASIAGNPYVSGVFANRLTGRLAFAISFPLKLRGRISGVIVGTVLLSDMIEIVEGMPLEDLGVVYVVDSEGRLISGTRWNIADSGSTAPVLTNFAAREAAAGRRGAGRYRDEAGDVVVGAYDWFPELSVGLVAELRNDRALLPVKRLLEFSAIYAAGMIVTLIVLGYLQSLRLIRPIRALVDAAETLEAREYADIAVKKTNTELDALIEAFNHMAQTIRSRESTLRENASRDSLTGLYNHAKIAEYLKIETLRKKRERGAVCFVMLDIDHFKKVNDNYGHLAGDAVLKGIARLLLRSCREGDIVGRYGGEEFAIILNSRTQEETSTYCERIRRTVEEADFSYEGQTIKITVSLGFACAVSSTPKSLDIVRAADQALYRAKGRGRNRVEEG